MAECFARSLAEPSVFEENVALKRILPGFRGLNDFVRPSAS